MRNGTWPVEAEAEATFGTASSRLRSELLDEAAINLHGVPFSFSPLIFVRDEIAQVVCLSLEWLAPEQLWCP